MNIIMDNRIESANNDKEEEVRKLQELIKKLEIQNEELRSERHALLSKNKEGSDTIGKNEVEKAESETNQTTNTTEKEKKSESVPPDVGIRLSLTLEEPNLSDDETWLLDSPKTKTHNEWLRKDLNDPSLVVVKKSLVKKLDEISNSPRQSPRHSLYSPSSSSGILSPESPPASREIDTRTFIRPKKRKSLAYDGLNDENRNTVIRKEPLAIASQNGSSHPLAQSSGSLGSEEEDRLSSASDGSYSSYRLTDVEDVNALARLQEESLKFPEPRPVGRVSGVRGSTRVPSTGVISPYNKIKPNAGSSGNSATSSQEDLLPSPPGPNQPSPRRTPTRSALPPPRRYPSSGIPYPSSRENSDMSTPPDSPYTSQQNLEACNAGRSSGSRLPSLNRRLGGSDPRLLDIQTSPDNSRTSSPQPVYGIRQGSSSEGRIPARTSRLQTPQARGSRLSAPSPVRIPLGPTQVAEMPRNKGPAEVPRAKQSSSALPRPGSRLQAPKTRTSQSPVKFSAQADWREGCY